MRQLDPAELRPVERYKLLIGGVVPRPIALVSTLDPAGRPNLAPFSFYNAIGSNPMLVQFCPANTPEGTEKDSLRNAAPAAEGGTGEFVVNVTVEDLAVDTAVAAEPLPAGESEWALAGLEAVPSVRVAPPRVAGTPMAYECVTERVIRFNPGAAGGSTMVIGRVVMVHVREDLLNERLHIDQAGLRAVGRMGGIRWCRTREQFELTPGVRAREATDPGIPRRGD
jgi:flavin reductase (DIM6/NTAB) family NADH-FMN oxidoreductase RutF